MIAFRVLYLSVLMICVACRSLERERLPEMDPSAELEEANTETEAEEVKCWNKLAPTGCYCESMYVSKIM